MLGLAAALPRSSSITAARLDVTPVDRPSAVPTTLVVHYRTAGLPDVIVAEVICVGTGTVAATAMAAIKDATSHFGAGVSFIQYRHGVVVAMTNHRLVAVSVVRGDDDYDLHVVGTDTDGSVRVTIEALTTSAVEILDDDCVRLSCM